MVLIGMAVTAPAVRCQAGGGPLGDVDVHEQLGILMSVSCDSSHSWLGPEAHGIRLGETTHHVRTGTHITTIFGDFPVRFSERGGET